MNQQQKDVWLAALRSGQYPQQRSRALQTEDGYCCLGVANEVLNLNSTSTAFLKDANSYSSFLPVTTQFALAGMNDHGKPFGEIADYIEKNVPPTE